jgi:hypothetical protein
MSNWVKPVKPAPMILQDNLKDVLFFDIETTTRYKTYAEYAEREPFMAKEFARRSVETYTDLTVEQAYFEKGMLHPEHAQVVSIAWKLWDSESKTFMDETIGFSSWDEFEYCQGPYADRDILIRFNNRLKEMFEDHFVVMGGYRIKGFDVEFLFNRMRVCGLEPQISLWECLKKSWDNRHLDIKDFWPSSKGMSSFGMICELIGVPNSKEGGISGSEVCFRFWDDHAVEMINEYCMDDVHAVTKLAVMLSTEKLKSRENQTLTEWEEWKKERDTHLENIRIQKEKESGNEVGE